MRPKLLYMFDKNFVPSLARSSTEREDFVNSIEKDKRNISANKKNNYLQTKLFTQIKYF